MKLEIENKGVDGQQAKVWIDGVERQDVVRIELILDAHEITRAHITFLTDVVDVDVEAEESHQ